MNPGSPSSPKPPEFTEDRLSNLPKDLVQSVLARLSLRDAVRTSILSHTWRYKWTNLSHLQFDRVDFPMLENQTQSEYDRKHVKIVDQVLLFHQGLIETFYLGTDLESCDDIGRWIHFLSRHGIKKFTLNKLKGQRYKIPSCLFSCDELQDLELDKCTLIPPPSFNGFSNLKNLTLVCVILENDGINNLISSCPLLNELNLLGVDSCTTDLNLYALKLTELEIDGAFRSFSFENTPLVTKARIILLNDYGEYQGHDAEATCKLIEIMNCLPIIKWLELLGNTLPILSAGCVPTKLSSECSHLSYLSIDLKFEDMQEILIVLCILRSSPNLQKIDIWSNSGKNRLDMPTVEDFWESQDEFNCRLCQLQIINFEYFTGAAGEMKFVEFVLLNAPVLEMAEIRLETNAANVAKILRRCNTFRRISSKAVVVFPE